MNDDQIQEAADAIRNQHGVHSVHVKSSGEIRVNAKAFAKTYDATGEAIAASVDADVKFLRASIFGRLHFCVS